MRLTILFLKFKTLLEIKVKFRIKDIFRWVKYWLKASLLNKIQIQYVHYDKKKNTLFTTPHVCYAIQVEFPSPGNMIFRESGPLNT